MFWRYFEQLKSGTYYNSDFTGARIEMRVRGVNWVPNDSTWRFWIQSRHAADPAKFANWCYTALDLNSVLTDGLWHDVDFTITSNSGDWTYAGGSGIYALQDLATSLSHIHNIHFPAVYAVGGVRPTGSVEIDWIRLTFPVAYPPNAPRS